MVLACRSISGSSCNGELGTLPARAGSFTALVRFTDAIAGDAIAVTLTGPGGTVAGGPFTLQGGGNGYYYSNFNVGGLPSGDYTLIATRNGSEVAADVVPAPLRLSLRPRTRSPHRGARSALRRPRAFGRPAR